MMRQEGHRADLGGALRAARGVRAELRGTSTEIDLRIKGGGGGGHRPGDGGSIAVACTFDIHDPEYDNVNGHFNDLVFQGCDCTQPVEQDGEWYIHCTCPDEED